MLCFFFSLHKAWQGLHHHRSFGRWFHYCVSTRRWSLWGHCHNIGWGEISVLTIATQQRHVSHCRLALCEVRRSPSPTSPSHPIFSLCVVYEKKTLLALSVYAAAGGYFLPLASSSRSKALLITARYCLCPIHYPALWMLCWLLKIATILKLLVLSSSLWLS